MTNINTQETDYSVYHYSYVFQIGSTDNCNFSREKLDIFLYTIYTSFPF